MNILVDLVPKSILICDMEYEINSDFRTGILFELLMQDKNVLEEDRVELALSLYFPKIPDNISKAVDKMLWFYRCGKDENVTNSGKGSAGNNKQIYSYEYDDDYIYSAFLTQYNIDLQDINYLHWWKFKALFKSLKEDNLFSKIMGYRSMKIDNNMSKEEKKYYKEMKRLYALPDNRTSEEKEDDFYNAISNMV